MTAHQEGEWVARAAQAGASAFIPEGGPLDELVTILKEVRPGPMRLAPSVLSGGASATENDELAEQLTPRELQVLRHLGQGLQAKGVAKMMGISVHTCRGCIKAVYAKLHATSRIEVVNRGR